MRRTLFIAVGLIALTGCTGTGKPPMEKTYRVAGKVLDARGNPVSAGSVQWSLNKPTDLTVTGLIQSDGTFALKTFRDREEATGAPEGEYQVTVILPITGGNAPPPPITLPKTYRVEPKDNNFEIRLPK